MYNSRSSHHLGTFDARCNRRARLAAFLRSPAPDRLTAFVVFAFILTLTLL